MKTLFTLFMLTTLPFYIYSQTDALDDFYAEHSICDNVFKLKIGNAFIKMGSWFIEEPAARNLVRKSKRARILFSDDSEVVSRKELDHLVKDLKRDGYESLAFVKDGLQKVEVYVREDRDIIRNLLVVVQGDEEFVMASLDCKLTYEEIEDAVNENSIY
ncbi:MAG: DUF4252 domain-containing protein [Saprospiraceae bacterium]|nr:DUF4252 domain-containing protein [Saprospiraceae bacterium]